MYACRTLARSVSGRSPLLRQMLLKHSLFRDRFLATKGSKEIKASGPTTIGPEGNIMVPPVTLKVIPFRMQPDLPYDDRNILLGRQLSPHLTIYKLQLTSGLSICLRISGFVLGVFVWALGIAGLCMQGDMEGFVKRVEDCDCHGLVTMAKVIVVMPFAYHLVAGTRHLIWYLNKFLTIPEVYATGYVAMVLSVAVAAGLLIVDVGEKVKEQVVDLTKPQNQGQKPPPKKDEKKEDAKKKDPKDAKQDHKKDTKGKNNEVEGKPAK
ncbi:uncharacterized protein LOC128259264 [Drosophila gunungcola]|uniref:Succinate dehydrogenase cytochrome b560 subunit, mitochondrial n=1 Tax=Drosophila gunungcola TaxID=103775 RepID=A0A9P9YW44_9MUSC|nr:uncharacterized protein LOC128259264 [Drosophila gunungcola]KAI8043995.1 hypothetical protein M5D96_000143 [Drosophila gunungcola]